MTRAGRPTNQRQAWTSGTCSLYNLLSPSPQTVCRSDRLRVVACRYTTVAARSEPVCQEQRGTCSHDAPPDSQCRLWQDRKGCVRGRFGAQCEPEQVGSCFTCWWINTYTQRHTYKHTHTHESTSTLLRVVWWFCDVQSRNILFYSILFYSILFYCFCSTRCLVTSVFVLVASVCSSAVKSTQKSRYQS